MADAPGPAPLGALRSRIVSPRAAPPPRPTPEASARVDHSPLADLVGRASDGWTVDYGQIAGSADLGDYLDVLANADPDALDRDEAVAFWINAYNASILSLVAARRPPRGINDIPGAFWGVRFRVGGSALTADAMEHAKARAFGDALVHFGLNCASRGCPPLAVYDGASVWDQLAANGRKYLADESRGAALEDATTVRLSRIFQWFAGDFAPVGSPPSELGTILGVLRPSRVLPFARQHLPDGLRAARDVKFLEYDWSLNRA